MDESYDFHRYGCPGSQHGGPSETQAEVGEVTRGAIAKHTEARRSLSDVGDNVKIQPDCQSTSDPLHGLYLNFTFTGHGRCNPCV
jgi:hypothetical protein